MVGLDRKVWRDLRRMKAQVLTIALVVSSGVAALVASYSTHNSLQRAQAAVYNKYRFADVFVDLKRAPNALEEKLAHIPGVAALETRIVHDALLHIPGRAETSVGRFISVPQDVPLQLNRLHLRAGRMINPERSDEVMISEGFAKANGFEPGDEIIAIMEGKYQKFHITGIVLSPEYIYAIYPANPLPDERLFGIIWTSEKTLESAFDMSGAFNSVALTLSSRDTADRVIADLDDALTNYGGFGAYDRDDQVSHSFVRDEIAQQRTMAVTLPFVFLLVAAYLLNVVISRLINLQRSQIATLKALGYSHWTVALHFLKLMAVIVMLGVVIGIGLGIWLGRGLTTLYTDFFHFPIRIYYLNPWLLLSATTISLGAGVLGTLGSLQRVFGLAPAEGMRPPAPPIFHGTLSERLGLNRFFSPHGRIVLRNLLLKPWRTLLGVIGIGFAIMIVMLGLFWQDVVTHMLYTQYSLIERGDVSVVFSEHISSDALRSLQQDPAVLSAEGSRTVPVRLGFQQRKKQAVLLGYPRDARLKQLIDRKLRPISMAPSGVILSRILADRLQIKAGQILNIDVLEEERQKFTIPVAAVIDDWLGSAAYIDLELLHKLLGGSRISSAELLVDAQLENQFYSRLKETPTVAAINVKATALAILRKLMDQFILIYAAILTAFAIVIAVGVVYNSARVTLSERSRELASLRVLGFTWGEVFRIVISQVAVQLLGALPLGWFLGYGLAVLMVQLMTTETQQFPMYMETSTFFYAALIIMAAASMSLLIISRRLRELDLIAALKVPE